MFNFSIKPNSEALKLDKVIDDLLDELNVMPGSDEDYPQTADQLIKLMDLKKKQTHSWKPSADVLVSGAVSIVGILLILNYEKMNVVSSKALNFVGKMK